jgi:hypothetical protein
MNRTEVDEYLTTAWPLLQKAWRKVMRQPWPIADLGEVDNPSDVLQVVAKDLARRWNTTAKRKTEVAVNAMRSVVDAPTGLAEWEKEHGSVSPEIVKWIRSMGELAIRELTEVIEAR